jgi:hypothetical protein
MYQPIVTSWALFNASANPTLSESHTSNVTTPAA